MEVLGKAPRAAKQRGDYLIIERRRQERIRSDNEVQKSYFETTLLKSKFELDTDRKIVSNKLDAYVSERLKKIDDNLESRRTKLGDLLTKEKQQYTEELLAKQETMEQREEKMRNKISTLKEAREKEQKAFVAHKLQQQWHNNCDDLRGAHSRVAMREAMAVRNQQMQELKEKSELLREEKIRDAQLWEQDRQRKIARAEAENDNRVKRNKELVESLSKQMENLKQKREHQQKLKMEQAELVKEYMANQKDDVAENTAQKRKEQRQRRNELDEMAGKKRERMIREREAELKSDLEMLQRVIESMNDGNKDVMQAKERLRKESMLYQQYVAEMAEWHRQQQQEIDEILAAETDKAFRAKIAATDKQAAARQSLMKEVLQMRQQQIQEKLARNETEIELNAKEAEEMQKDIALHKAQEEELIRSELEIKQQYKKELDGQMQFAQECDEVDRKLLEFEYEQAKKNEEEYQRCLKLELSRMLGTK